MIQIKDVTKLYPAKAAGNEKRQGQGDHNGPLIAPRSHFPARGARRVAVDHGAVGVGEIVAGELIGCLDARPPARLARRAECWPVMSRRRIESRARGERLALIFQQFHLIPFLTAVETSCWRSTSTA